MNNLAEHVLLVDDDEIFCGVMLRALTRRGLASTACRSVAEAEHALKHTRFTKAIVDLKIAGDSGLALIKTLKQHQPDLPIVMLTGYSSVPTAVEAIKLGATHYLCKPVSLDDILKAFGTSESNAELTELESTEAITAPSLDRIEWEHIQKALMDNNGNISATARCLGMHRRTLQRKLLKRPVTR